MTGKDLKSMDGCILKTVPDDNNDGDYHPTGKIKRCFNVSRLWFKTPSRVAAAVCLGGLLLFVGLWIQCVYGINLDGLESRYNNLVEKNKQLTIRLNNLSNERDQLQTSNNSLSKERDQLQKNYNNLSKESDQLQTSYNNLSKERDQLQKNYNNLSKERDQLQTSYNNLSKERDQLQTNYNNLSKERDQLQTELKQEQVKISKLLHLKNKSRLNYPCKILLYSIVLMTCLSCVMMF